MTFFCSDNKFHFFVNSVTFYGHQKLRYVVTYTKCLLSERRWKLQDLNT